MESKGKFVYHLVPLDLRGTVLYPLNQLKTVYPEVAAKQPAKYGGREHALQQRVLPLDCLWNDVLMFSPIPSWTIKATIEEAGHLRPARKWFEIAVAPFTPENTALYLPGEDPSEEQIIPYMPGCLVRYADIPEGASGGE